VSGKRALGGPRNSLIVLVAALGLLVMVGPALAAPQTEIDAQGANDEPGQKDLTQLTVDFAGLPDTLVVGWSWDEIAWPGANTGDACALFSTDGDLFVDAAMCVIVGETPVEFITTALFTCNNTQEDRCAWPAAAAGTFDCEVGITETDPFTEGDESPEDTSVLCTIDPAVQISPNATLVNVCSYPSGEPNSDPSDCILLTPITTPTPTPVATPVETPVETPVATPVATPVVTPAEGELGGTPTPAPQGGSVPNTAMGQFSQLPATVLSLVLIGALAAMVYVRLARQR
jgi:hypothetical protein